MLTRDEALKLLEEYVTDPGLRRHCLAVEAAMRAYAPRFGEDPEAWGLVGLLHDFDYERWPDPPDHPLRGASILAEKGLPEDLIYAIKSHADYLPDCPRIRPIEKALYACDELTGLLLACALVRPNGIADLTPASVKKKLKSKGFAAKVDREQIYRGAAEFGVDLDAHIQFLIEALKPHAELLGIAGSKTSAPGQEAD